MYILAACLLEGHTTAINQHQCSSLTAIQSSWHNGFHDLTANWQITPEHNSMLRSIKAKEHMTFMCQFPGFRLQLESMNAIKISQISISQWCIRSGSNSSWISSNAVLISGILGGADPNLAALFLQTGTPKRYPRVSAVETIGDSQDLSRDLAWTVTIYELITSFVPGLRRTHD